MTRDLNAASALEADYVIVGAGSSGCVLAERLSADPKVRVLLLEAGPEDRSLLIRMPRGIGRMLTPGDPHVWDYDVAMGGNRGSETWLKGRTLGGSSSVNGMVYVRGQPQDYDAWERAGCAGWGWAEMGRCFKALEDHELGPGPERGAGGPLKVSVHPKGDAVLEAVIRAAEDVGIPRVGDVNEAEQGGIGYQTRTISKGRRWSAADAFLKPAASRPNLRVLTGARARRIFFEGRRAAGVELEVGGVVRVANARREVILSAGAVQSPALLQVSGVGPAAWLQSLGVPVLVDAPGVGENLREHRAMMMMYRLADGGLNHEFHGLRLLANVLRYQFLSSGPMTHAAHELCAFVKSDPGLERADCELGFGLFSISLKDGKVEVDAEPGLSIAAYYCRPDSRGSIRIQSKDPMAPPKIDANYFGDVQDRRRSVDMIRLVRRLMGGPALSAHVVAELAPGPGAQSDEEILEAFFTSGSSCYHVSGTCRMGADPSSVVDPDLKVRGVSGLRVVDTSIMPELVTGNTNGPAMAIGLRASELILKDAAAPAAPSAA